MYTNASDTYSSPIGLSFSHVPGGPAPRPHAVRVVAAAASSRATRTILGHMPNTRHPGDQPVRPYASHLASPRLASPRRASPRRVVSIVVPGELERDPSGAPRAKRRAQHVLLDLPRGGAGELVHEPQLLRPLLPRQAALLQEI